MKTLEDTSKDTECSTTGSPPLLPYSTHLCLLPPSSPQEATEALYIPDKTFSEGHKGGGGGVG